MLEKIEKEFLRFLRSLIGPFVYNNLSLRELYGFQVEGVCGSDNRLPLQISKVINTFGQSQRWQEVLQVKTLSDDLKFTWK